MKIVKGFKAFNKGMKCNGFQYEEGEIYQTDSIILCEKGFHFCKNPLDVLNYYNLCESEFAEVEALGKTISKKGKNEDSKTVTTKLKIRAKLNLDGFVKASVDFLLEVCRPSIKLLAASGDSAQLAASSDCAKLEINGEDSIGAGIGLENIIKGKKGSWITLAEWKYDDDKKRHVPICVKSAQIDGEILKENVWYKLVKGEFEIME